MLSLRKVRRSIEPLSFIRFQPGKRRGFIRRVNSGIRRYYCKRLQPVKQISSRPRGSSYWVVEKLQELFLSSLRFRLFGGFELFPSLEFLLPTLCLSHSD
jgi:hypothetical protein